MKWQREISSDEDMPELEAEAPVLTDEEIIINSYSEVDTNIEDDPVDVMID